MENLIKPYRILLTAMKVGIDLAESIAGSVTTSQYELRIRAVICLEELALKEPDWKLINDAMDEIQVILDARQPIKAPFAGGYVDKQRQRLNNNHETIINKQLNK